MHTEFYNRFVHYSNAELLKIIKRPENYQPAAVQAASEILATRDVSDSDHMEADQFYEDLEKNKQQQEEQINKAKGAVFDILEPFIKPGTEVKAARWIRIFLVILFLQYIWLLIETIRHLVKAIRYDHYDFNILLYFSALVYIPVLFNLIYKRRRWGWFLLFGENVFAVIISLAQFILFFNAPDWYPVDHEGYLWMIAIRTIFIFFLWRPEICEHFNITPDQRKKYALRITFIVLAISIILFFLPWGISLI